MMHLAKQVLRRAEGRQGKGLDTRLGRTLGLLAMAKAIDHHGA